MEQEARLDAHRRYVALLRSRLDRAGAAVRRERDRAARWEGNCRLCWERREELRLRNRDLESLVGELTREIERLKQGG